MLLRRLKFPIEKLRQTRVRSKFRHQRWMSTPARHSSLPNQPSFPITRAPNPAVVSLQEAGWTPLCTAASQGKVESVKQLLMLGLGANLSNSAAMSLTLWHGISFARMQLLHRFWRCRSQCSQQLGQKPQVQIRSSSRVMLQNAPGAHPIFYALRNWSLRMFRLLAKHGADVQRARRPKGFEQFESCMPALGVC